MSHDTDKLIRQLSLVAFLMAERRPLTARDVKGNVEGYSEMSDEAFARRFYSDRAELPRPRRPAPVPARRVHRRGAVHAPLGELLPARARADRRRARRAPDLLLPARGQVRLRRAAAARAPEPRARPARRCATRRRRATAVRVEMRDPDYSAEMPGRLAKLETAISKQRTVKFGYRAMTSGKETERTLNPYGLLHDRGVWYVDRPGPRPRRDPHVPRLAHPRRHPLRHAARARLPAPGRLRHRARTAAGPPWQFGELVGEARIEVRPRDRPGGSSAPSARAAGSRTASSSPSTPACRCSPPGCCARTAARLPVAPDELRREVAREPPARARRARGRSRRKPAREVHVREADGGHASAPPGRSRRSASGCSRRCSRTCSPPAARTRTRSSRPPRSLERFQIPPEELEDDLNLLNLVNFGGGCYAVYAELHDDEVHVDKELWGDTFRAAPRLTPLEARAIRLALEFVGPLIAAEAHRPLDRVRKKLEETFGAVRARARRPSRAPDKAEEEPRRAR